MVMAGFVADRGVRRTLRSLAIHWFRGHEMDLRGRTSVASKRLTRLLIATVLPVALGVPTARASDCGECDVRCHLDTDAFALMEAYVEDTSGFAARSARCSQSDELWTEVYDNIRELDQPPPTTNEPRRREVSRLELAMINHEIGLSSCMLLCGQERYRENCVGGPGGMSCDCKPGAWAYCRSQSNDGIVGTIAPNYSGGGGSTTGSSDHGGAARDGEEQGAEQIEAEPPQEVDEEPLYLIEVAVSAEGFEPATASAPCYVEPSSVTVEGKVLDDARVPVPGARVVLEGLGAVVRTDREGRYSLTARTEGDTPFHAVRNIMIVRSIDELRATVTPSSTVWANGREVEAVLTVLADGRPYAGKIVTLTDWKAFSRGGDPVDYVVPGRGNHHNILLDEAGSAKFRFFAPVVPRDRGAAIQNPAEMFPVEGHLRVMVRNQDAETECDYRVDSPFPKIGRIRVPGNVDAGLWQVKPSTIEIEDPDSSRFTVTVRGLGDFRTTRPGAATKAGVLSHELVGNQFEFLYRPPKAAFDPSKLPDELDQFMNTSKNIYISVVTNVVGGMLVDKVQVVFPSDALGAYLVKKGMSIDANKLLDAGGNMANVVNLGTATYNDMSEIQADPDNPEKKVIAAGNYLIGVVDTAMGFAGTLGSVKAKLYWEGAKAYWEYVKLMNSLTNQYEEIGNAYQGTSFYPIEVTVEDESGHRTTTSRACSVRVWKGGSQ